jgi:hypothetical protein
MALTTLPCATALACDDVSTAQRQRRLAAIPTDVKKQVFLNSYVHYNVPPSSSVEPI